MLYKAVLLLLLDHGADPCMAGDDGGKGPLVHWIGPRTTPPSVSLFTSFV